MSKQTTAVLLSAFVYPGAGHLFLKKYTSCFALAGAFSVPLFMVISETVKKANAIVEKIIAGEIPLDVAAITESISNLISGTEAREFNIKIYVMLIVWAIGVLDAYRVSREKR